MLKKRIAAIRTIYRMIRLTEKRMDLFSKAELQYKISFFDLVFLAMKRLKYDKFKFNEGEETPLQDKFRRNAVVSIPSQSVLFKRTSNEEKNSSIE